MSSTVQNLQEAVTSGQQSLTQLLRQTKLIAAKLNLEGAGEWLDLELNGYAEGNEPPGYRKPLSHSLEVYNASRGSWQFAGKLNYALEVRQPLGEIERFAQEDRVPFPVLKNFSIKSDFGDSFGSDWPQRFVVAGSQFKSIIEAVANRWTSELEERGIKVFDIQKFSGFLSDCSRQS
jgi:hypothetical protein